MKAIKYLSVPGLYAGHLRLLTAVIMVLFIFSKGFGQISGLSVESPGTLGRHGFEAAVNVGGMGGFPFNQTVLSPRIGIKLGTGITEYFDLKVFFFRHIRSDINDGFNVVQLIPKISNKKGRFCFYIPVGIFQDLVTDEYEKAQNRLLYFISPRISGDIVRTRQFELYIGAYGEIFMSEGDPPFPLIGLTTGFGFYSYSRRIFFRTEFGLDLFTLAYGQPVWNFGCTFGYNILSAKKKYRNLSKDQNMFLTTVNRGIAFRY